MAATQQQVEEFVHKALGDVGRSADRPPGGHRRQARAVQGAWPGPAAHPGRAGGADGHDRALRPRVAQRAGGRRLRDLRRGDGRYTLPDAHAAALADEDSPACVLGAFQGMTAAMRANGKVIEAFRSGRGVGWHEHDPELFAGTERFFRPGYIANLVDAWIPALDGVAAKLERGARVADVGCGHGASTIIMAKAFPSSTFVGFDYHQASIDAASERARTPASATTSRFEVAPAKEFPGTGYDLVTCFDCLHDMGDPVGAARHVRQSLAPDGTLHARRAVRERPGRGQPEPGRPRSSTRCRRWSARRRRSSQEVGLALGAQAGEGRLRDVLRRPASRASGARRRRRSTW